MCSNTTSWPEANAAGEAGVAHLLQTGILCSRPSSLLDARLDGRPVMLALLSRSAWHAL